MMFVWCYKIACFNLETYALNGCFRFQLNLKEMRKLAKLRNFCLKVLQKTYFSGRVISVACGYAHTLFLMESGVIYSCGNGTYGQLGSGVEIKKRFEPEAVLVPDKVVMIASKYFHCLAVSEGQKIYCWGANPQALKMKMFVKRRLRSEADKSTSTTGKKNDKLAINNDYLMVTEIQHMVRLLYCFF